MAWGAIATVTLAMLGTVAPQYFVEKDTSSVTVNLSSIYDFSFDLYRQLSPKGRAENILFSPYSIWAALALAYFGSEGDTKIQLKAALRVTDKISTLKLWRKLGMKYSENATTVTQHSLSVVNRAYFDESLTLRPYMSKILHSELKLIDFSDLQESAATINAFVSNYTNGKIPTLLSPDDLVYAVMLLINAAYFKGTWKYQFDSSSTASKQFFVSPGNPVDVLMMKTKTKLRLVKSTELQANVLEVPYVGDAFSLLLFLPDTEGEEGLSYMVSMLTSDSLLKVTNGNDEAVMIDLLLPKFTLEQIFKDDLKESLRNLGIRNLFNASLADLSQFAVSEQLVVTSTIHKAYIEVNEEGTEAAAVGVVGSYARSLESSEQSFHCNRPFMFIIHDKETNNVLFIGAYMKPQT